METKEIVKKILIGVGITLSAVGAIYQSNSAILIGGISLIIGEVLMILQ